MQRLAIIGTGYVGLVTGTCLAELGNSVTCLDSDHGKIESLRGGTVPFFEPGLEEMARRNAAAGRLHFSHDVERGIRDADIIFIAVGTPMGDDGRADLSAVQSVAATIGRALNGPKLIVSKSTVPVQTGELISAIIDENRLADHPVSIASNPEFLREGSAVSDFMQPDRIVIGVQSADAERVMTDLYAPLQAPVVVTDVRTSEMIKYAANTFLATKISFMNEIATICEAVDVDVKSVARGIGLDHRIGTTFMNPGIGYGGSCFPKDVVALERLAAEKGYAAGLLRAVSAVNEHQIDRTVAKIDAALQGVPRDRSVAVLGLTFKPNTDDLREAPALKIIARLLAAGIAVRAHDPITAAAALPQLKGGFTLLPQAYDAIHDADVVLLATEWNEYKALDFAVVRKLMRGRTVVDGRNLFDPAKVTEHGLIYVGVGRAQSPERYVEETTGSASSSRSSLRTPA